MIKKTISLTDKEWLGLETLRRITGSTLGEIIRSLVDAHLLKHRDIINDFLETEEREKDAGK